jgi:hypothetical protein
MYTIKNVSKRCVVTVALRSFQRHEQDFYFPLCILVARNHTGKKVFALPFVIRKNDVELGKFVCGMVGLSEHHLLASLLGAGRVYRDEVAARPLHHPSGCYT